MAAPHFIHLRVHSDFSMIDGLQKITPIVERAAQLGMPALALTDRMNLCGLVRFYSAAQQCGIKPIIGADLYVESLQKKGSVQGMTALVIDNQGYKNLTQLISNAYLRGYDHHQPIVSYKDLKQFREGILILSGGLHSDLGQAILYQRTNIIEQEIAFFQTYFPDRFYLEVSAIGQAQEQVFIHESACVAQQYNLPLVATNFVCFLDEDDFDAHEIRVSIHRGQTLDDPRREKAYQAKQYFRTEQEMLRLFAQYPQALQNTVEIAKRCNATITLDKYALPEFPTAGQTTEDFLISRAQKGLERRLEQLFPDSDFRDQKRPEYEQRLQVELSVINQMGFPGYFLIVMEFIQWAKQQGIAVGPGRGSGAGSLVAYVLDITDLDPLAYDLLFERFLNPERISMPDFDIDFCMERRDEVIEHVTEVYGRQAVSQIITFGTMAAKAVVRDVGRVLGHPYGFVDRIAKLIPLDLGMTLSKALEVEPKLAQLCKQDDEVGMLMDMAQRLEGVTRNAGKHAGGVVIAPRDICDYSPLYCDEQGEHVVTQFDKNDVERVGLVKFDFLGLKTLTIIQRAVEMINVRLAKTKQALVDITQIPLNDQKAFNLLQQAHTTAVFQLESRGMKDLIKRLQPDCFEDMIALVALFRPGPLQSGMVDNFIDRKKGKEIISYPDPDYQHESLKPILEPTYGIILYQEQVMQIAQTLAGYTLGRADLLRRAMGKKKPEEMVKQRAVFQEGAQQNGINADLAVKIFDLVEKFAGYGFNKSHSAAYALVSYQTLWLKAHYPAEFMAAVMTADLDHTDKIVTMIEECQRMGLTILKPDVNSSHYAFTVNEKGQIVYGLGAIKGVGKGPAQEIMQGRAQQGAFRDLLHFCQCINIKRFNKRILEKLILSGACDQLGPHRAALMAALEEAIQSAEQLAHNTQAGLMDMFGITETVDLVSKRIDQVTPWSEKVRLDGERETLGLYLSGHPMHQYKKEFAQYIKSNFAQLVVNKKKQEACIAGLVVGIRTLMTRRGSRMGIVTLDDSSGRLDVTLFQELLEKYEYLLEKDEVLVFSGQLTLDDYNQSHKMIAKEVLTVEQARERFFNRLRLRIPQGICNADFIQWLQTTISPDTPGNCMVVVDYVRPDASVSANFDQRWNVTLSDRLITALKTRLGKENVQLET